MPQQLTSSVENNFTKGLITESTGLNFPENAATDTDNCEYTLIGDTLRRRGIDMEFAFRLTGIDRTNAAISEYKWNNVGGDGVTQLVATQVATSIFFWSVNASTVDSPLSQRKLTSFINLAQFVAPGALLDGTAECTYSDGNGYLFIFHPSCDPVYCTYDNGTITGTRITVQIRDFTGVPELSPVSLRPAALNASHNYNLVNQGWSAGNPWSATSTTTHTVSTGSKAFTVAAGIAGIVNGTQIYVYYGGPLNPLKIPAPGGLPTVNDTLLRGTVTGYAGTTLTLNIDVINGSQANCVGSSWLIVAVNNGYIDSWFTAIGNYPSNADVWWYFKNASNVFAPATTVANVSLSTSNAPRGHYILDAFNQQRDVASGLAITDVVTTTRPRTGAWFQGRVWYTSVNAQQPASGTAGYYSWTENIYFSQIVTTPDNFSQCYQANDPTSEKLFDLLPTDGGVITIQGCGAVYKLFPIQNGMLVFAANGIWYITGSQGIGFTANDYTVTKISAVPSISSTSYVDVKGLPFFWNEDGIYTVEPSQNGGLQVNPITVGTIQSFYDDIPTSSKKFVRGAYHPIDYVIQWVYKSTEAVSVNDRYSFNKILNFNTYNKAFFPYTLTSQAGKPTINGILYVAGPGGSNTPPPGFKYFSSFPDVVITQFSFADEHDETYVDWKSTSTTNYVSYFITGYKLRGQAIKQFQPQYIQMYSKANGAASAYKIQGIWNYANSGDSGKWSSEQLITNALTNFSTVFRRHKIRGRGFALQFKISSADGLPFDIQGWAVVDTVNTGT